MCDGEWHFLCSVVPSPSAHRFHLSQCYPPLRASQTPSLLYSFSWFSRVKESLSLWALPDRDSSYSDGIYPGSFADFSVQLRASWGQAGVSDFWVSFNTKHCTCTQEAFNNHLLNWLPLKLSVLASSDSPWGRCWHSGWNSCSLCRTVTSLVILVPAHSMSAATPNT